MLYVPKKYKHAKAFRSVIKGEAVFSGNYVAFGEVGLKALTSAKIDGRQLEAARRAVTGGLNRLGRVWRRISPSIPLSKKPNDTRMGKGKGPVEKWIVCVKPGCVIFEVGGVGREVAVEALLKAAKKLPVKSKLVFLQEPIYL